MSIETEKHDSVNTHWVRVMLGNASLNETREDTERRLERVFYELNERALKEDKVIVSLSHTCSANENHDIVYTIIVQVVDRKILERQQFQRRIERN